MNLVYRNEERLFRLMLVWSVLIWGVLLVITFGLALVYLLFGFLFYCVAQSALISYIKGNGLRITEEQFPDLKQQISACCRKLGLEEEPQACLMQMGGMLNAFATRFLGRHFLVLYSDVVDGLADNPDALNFYIGHELRQPSRNKLAAVLAMFVPRTGIGSGAAAVVSIFMVAVMAAVAIPAYKEYQVRAQEAAEMQAVASALEKAAVNPGDPASTPSDH